MPDKRFLRIVSLWLFALLLPCNLAAQSRGDIATELAKQMENNVFALAAPVRGNKLAFTADGKPVKTLEPGSVAVHSAFYVESVKVDKVITMEARRLVIYYDENRKPRATATRERLEIQQELPSNATMQKVLTSVRTLLRNDDLFAAVPPPLSIPAPFPPLDPANQVVVFGNTAAGQSVYRVSNRVKPPKVISAPDPSYPEDMKQQKKEGTLVVLVVLDSNGSIYNLQVARRLFGREFSDAAAAAVGTWKFQPASLDGRPVAVAINVEVNFRLY
jgi:TonB family protein